MIPASPPANADQPRHLFVGHRYLGELREVRLYDYRTSKQRSCLMTERDAVVLAEDESLELHYTETYDP